ncbi:MAG: small basic protein [bacterium]|nr:small basic protein [bacterium]
MSIHPSLRGVDTLTGDRSVFTRIERLQKLMKEGKIDADASPFGLPKVRTIFKVKSTKKKADDEAAEGEEGEEAKAEGDES